MAKVCRNSHNPGTCDGEAESATAKRSGERTLNRFCAPSTTRHTGCNEKRETRIRSRRSCHGARGIAHPRTFYYRLVFLPLATTFQRALPCEAFPRSATRSQNRVLGTARQRVTAKRSGERNSPPLLRAFEHTTHRLQRKRKPEFGADGRATAHAGSLTREPSTATHARKPRDRASSHPPEEHVRREILADAFLSLAATFQRDRAQRSSQKKRAPAHASPSQHGQSPRGNIPNRFRGFPVAKCVWLARANL